MIDYVSQQNLKLQIANHKPLLPSMKYESPESTRISISTNIRLIKPPSNKFRLTSILAWIFLTISIIVVSFELLRQQISDDESRKEPIQRSQINKGIIYFDQQQDLLQDNHLYQINIPLLYCKECSQTNQQRKLQLQESLQNIQIFELLNNKKSSNNNVILERYFVKMQPLFAIKHPKFTSPHLDSQLSITNFNWWNPFYDSTTLRYKGVDKLFLSNNNEPWISKGKYFTIVSEFPFKPTLIIIYVNSFKNRSNIRLYVYGLSAFESTLASRNTLEQTFIKKVELVKGRNQIQCDKPQCSAQYSMIMLVLDQINLMSLQIYSRKKYINFK